MENEEYPVAMFIRLQNGDDIVAETVEIEDENGILYMLYNPLKVFYSQSPNNGFLAVSFMPWVFPKICDHQEFTVHAEDVILVSNVSETMNKYYWENVKDLVSVRYGKEQDTEPEEEIDEDYIKELLSKRTLH